MRHPASACHTRRLRPIFKSSDAGGGSQLLASAFKPSWRINSPRVVSLLHGTMADSDSYTQYLTNCHAGISRSSEGILSGLSAASISIWRLIGCANWHQPRGHSRGQHSLFPCRSMPQHSLQGRAFHVYRHHKGSDPQGADPPIRGKTLARSLVLNLAKCSGCNFIILTEHQSADSCLILSLITEVLHICCACMAHRHVPCSFLPCIIGFSVSRD